MSKIRWSVTDFASGYCTVTDLEEQTSAEYTSSIYSRLLDSNAFARHGFSLDESAHVIGTQLGSNLGVRLC